MPAEWSDDSYFKKEMKRWDAPKREGGENRNGYLEFPKMLYKTQPHPISGKHEVAIDKDVISLDKTTVILDSQAFNNSCQTIVNNADEEDRYKREGWRNSQAEAVQYHLDELNRLATEAAYTNSDDARMSEKALAEKDRYERSVPGHVAEVPEARKVRKPMSEEHKAALRAGKEKARAAKAGTEPAA